MQNCVQGWNWVDEGRDGRHKYGYVTEEPDHDIIFVVGLLNKNSHNHHLCGRPTAALHVLPPLI